MLSAFFQKLRLAVNQRRFDREIGGILDTPPVNLGSEPFIALSMVHHRDVGPYLLAIKSFCRFLHPHRIIVVADPTITDADRSRISAHVCGVEFARAEDYREVGLPRGGCWERLIAISEFVQDDYVIQLDADTVALADMEEIRDAVQRRSSFVLATEDGQDFVSLAQAASWARPRAEAGEHVQILAEANLDRLPGASSGRYVRGCAGFSGFAPGSFSRAQLREFSHAMGVALGDKWSAWGTEQFASNYMVSNSAGSCVLPHPKYCHPGRERPGTVFLHFIGYVRFNTDRYGRAAKEVCVALTPG